MSAQGKPMSFLLIAAVVVVAATVAIALLVFDAAERTDKFWPCLGFLVFAELFLFLGGLVGRNTLPIRLVYLVGVIIVTVASPYMSLTWLIVAHIILAALAVILLLGFGFASRHEKAHTGADKTSRVFIDDLKILVDGICDRLKLCDKEQSEVVLGMVEGLQGGAIYSALPRSNAGCLEEDAEIETLVSISASSSRQPALDRGSAE